MFVFQCMVGCRHSDLVTFTPENIIDGVLEYIPIKTINKVARTVRVPLVKKAMIIYQKHNHGAGLPLFPMHFNFQFNDAIREIFKRANVKRIVTVLNPVTRYEAQYVDSYFPDFDSKFHWQAEEKMNCAPNMAGTMNDFSSSLLHDLQDSCEHIGDAGKSAMQVGLHALGVILFHLYEPTMSSCGGGGSSSKLGCGDDDKYKKKKRNYGRSFGLRI